MVRSIVVGYLTGRGFATGIRVPTAFVFRRFTEVDMGKKIEMEHYRKLVLASLKGRSDDAADYRPVCCSHRDALTALHLDLLTIRLPDFSRIDNE